MLLLVCVANDDDDVGRVLCYNAGIKNSHKLGQQISQYMHPKVGPVYAITFNHQGMHHLCSFIINVSSSSTWHQHSSHHLHPPYHSLHLHTTPPSTDSLLYGVAAKTGGLPAVAFTLDVLENPIYSSDFVSFWTPDGEEEDEEDVEESKNETDKQVDLALLLVVCIIVSGIVHCCRLFFNIFILT